MKLLVLFVIVCASVGQNVLYPDRNTQKCLVDQTLYSELQLLKCELTRVRKELGQTKERLEQTQGRLNQTVSRLNQAESQIEQVQGKMDKVETEVETEVDLLIRMLNGTGNLHPQDCAEVQLFHPLSGNGVYTIRTSDGSTKQVYCDMTTGGGGWLVFQRRQDGTENFYRNWTDYRHGFGRLDGEFWLGNDALAFITNQRSYELRVDLEDYNGVKAYAIYDYFSLDQRDNYELSLGDYTGTAGDSLRYNNGVRFSTYDRDHDFRHGNCAISRKGAWWYESCTLSNLNGQYGEGRGIEYVYWYEFRSKTSLKFTEMKIRPTSKN